MHYDYIIVGGGSAGSVLANRLSARSANRVLLLEAGEDTPHGAVPEEILDSYPGTAYLNKRFHWNDLKVTTEVISGNAPPDAPRPPLRKYEQARVLGGGSSINGQMANRGAPTDYAEWEARGATGWGWDDVLPYFKKLERDMDFDDEFHGQSGRIPVRRIFPESWSAHAHAVAKALESAGFEYLPDQNGEFREGYFPITISNVYERRVSAAIGYLDPTTRQRPNLELSTNTVVSELVFEGLRCCGVKAFVNGAERTFHANEVILSSGAIHSPAHLLRAGIGPALALKDLGIEPRVNLQGVGQRLMDHPSISCSSFILPQARINPYTRRHILVGLRYTSDIPDVPLGDMFVAVVQKSSWHAVGAQIASMLTFVNRTYSESGQVRLATANWRDEPIVEFNLLSDRRDLDRLMAGFRMLAGLHEHPAMLAATADPFPASFGDKVRQVSEVNARNRLLTGVFAKLLDGPAPLRRWLMNRFVLDGFSFADVMTNDEALEAFVRRSAVGVWHASCTCRMGADDDPDAVTNSAGQVRGVGGLRVCDASVFPIVPSANTNLPTLMTAEKIADQILTGA
ncbi:MAG: GMC family oxidoreductase N-terminal domain-containing protein [Pseudomonadota bacterium]